MIPEETVQASVDVKAKRIIPIHWGAFKFAMHPWAEQSVHVSIKAKELGVDMIITKISQPFYLDENSTTMEEWWLNFKLFSIGYLKFLALFRC
ncbi:hypothetical protein [Maribacter sp. ACAM166]|uniref:hypothetical protein n=1 Tax=Maribacter sp. ACAM166 TaxID=2508996 RepID=UPI001BB126CD|nr:hypothetical protein [Maribacter sp. ACAM166]